MAVATFSYAVRKSIGAFAAVLGGLDALVFTGGIGERSPEIRADSCRDLEALGVVLDPARNGAGDDPISATGSRCVVRVIPTDEDRVIARHVRRALATQG
jgi:acetate kinase